MTTADRSTWARGPWDNEPDREEFHAHGFPCLIRRGGQGAWCGYVAVPPGHPWHGRDWARDDCDPGDIHGGITYSDYGSGGISHPDADKDAWWVAFDCGHYCDFTPEMSTYWKFSREGMVYRDIDYVRNETIRLAKMAKEWAE